MKNYSTSEVARMIGIHPNTVRKYEEWEFITKPKRLKNGYRIFTDLHLYQFQYGRLAVKNEIVENGLRTKAISLIKTLALGNVNETIKLNQDYLLAIQKEEKNALQAIEDVTYLIHSKEIENELHYTKKEVLELLDLSPDTLRNWERNGLLLPIKKDNGYKIYTKDNIKRINIIKTLRLANYSLSAILRMLSKLDQEVNIDILMVINNPEENEEIISVCDQLLTSLKEVEQDAIKMLEILKIIKSKF